MSYYEQQIRSLLEGMQQSVNEHHLRAAEDMAIAGEVQGIIDSLGEADRVESARLAKNSPQFGQVISGLSEAQEAANIRGWASLFG